MRRSTWKGVSRDSATPWSWSVLIFILKPLWTLSEFSQLRQHNSAPAVIFTIACRRSTSRGGRRDVSHNSVYQVWHDHVWVGQRFLYYLAVDLVCARRVRSSRTSRCPFSLEAFSVSILLLWVAKTITSLSCRLARKVFLTTMTLHSTFVRYIQKGKMCNMAAQYVWKQYMQEIFWIRSTANLVFQLIFVPDSNLSSHDCPLLFSAFSSLTLYEATAEWKE